MDTQETEVVGTGPHGPASILTEEQRARFVRDGFLIVPGLIPRAIMASTRDRLLAELEIAPEDPASWQKPLDIARTDLMELTAPCRTPAIEAVVEQLIGPAFLPGVTYAPFLETHGFEAKLYPGFIPIIKFPTPGLREFVKPTGYHIDGIHRTRLWPDDMYLVIFAYLSDVVEYGAATTVLPGSHRQVFEHWYTRQDLGSTHPPELAYADPLPVPGKAGDVIFMHYLTVHSGSENRSDVIRVGLNTSVVPDPDRPYVRKTGSPTAEWTPLDLTLRTDNLAKVG